MQSILRFFFIMVVLLVSLLMILSVILIIVASFNMQPREDELIAMMLMGFILFLVLCRMALKTQRVLTGDDPFHKRYKAKETQKSNGIQSQENPDETKMIQELYRGFNQMEKRLESLETILMDRAQHEKETERWK